jgi:hypothetical protein
MNFTNSELRILLIALNTESVRDTSPSWAKAVDRLTARIAEAVHGEWKREFSTVRTLKALRD